MMEFLIVALVVWIGWALIKGLKPSFSQDSSNGRMNKADAARAISQRATPEKPEVDSGGVIKKDSDSGIHRHHNVHEIHERSKPPKEKSKGHTEKVWNDLGYQVKVGESYSYKYYGREIFTPDQVEKIESFRGRIARPGLSKNQIKVKTIGLALVEKTGSKRRAKDILVEEYGFDEKTAKYAAGYRGYQDY